MASPTSPTRHGQLAQPIRFVSDRSVHLPTAPIRLDMQTTGLITVHVDRRLTVRDIIKEMEQISARAMNSSFWSHRTAAAGGLHLDIALDATLPRRTPVEYVELGGPAHVGIRPGLGVDEMLGRVLALFTAGMRAHWELRLPVDAQPCRLCGVPLPDSGVCEIC